MPRFILASSSPRRLELLRQIGYVPDAIIPADLDETVLHKELPRAHCERLAVAKATKLAEQYPDDVILGSDSTVSLGRRIFGKPENEEEAREFMRLLSGRRHKAITAVCVAQGARKSVKVVETVVHFKRLEDDEIEGLVRSGDWDGKCGGYGIQGFASGFVKKINGAQSNVIGLPLYEAKNLLKAYGVYPSA